MSGGVDSAVAAARALDGRATRSSACTSRCRARRRRCASRRPRLLHDRGRRDARRVADVLGIPFYVWDLAEPVRARRRRRLRRRVRRRPHAEPVPALQRADQVRRRCSTGRWRWASTPSAPGTTRGSSTGRRGASCTGPSTRPRTSRTCSGCSTPTSSRTRSSRSATRRSPTVREEAARARAARWRRSPTATTSASSPTATPRAWLSRRLGRAARRARRRRIGRGRRRARGRLRVHRRPAARAAASTGRRSTASRATSLDVQPVTNRVVIGPADLLGVDRAARAAAPALVRAGAGAGRPRRRPGARARRGGARHRRRRSPPTATSRWSSTSRSAASRPASRSSSTTGTRVVGSATLTATARRRRRGRRPTRADRPERRRPRGRGGRGWGACVDCGVGGPGLGRWWTDLWTTRGSRRLWSRSGAVGCGPDGLAARGPTGPGEAVDARRGVPGALRRRRVIDGAWRTVRDGARRGCAAGALSRGTRAAAGRAARRCRAPHQADGVGWARTRAARAASLAGRASASDGSGAGDWVRCTRRRVRRRLFGADAPARSGPCHRPRLVAGHRRRGRRPDDVRGARRAAAHPVPAGAAGPRSGGRHHRPRRRPARRPAGRPPAVRLAPRRPPGPRPRPRPGAGCGRTSTSSPRPPTATRAR